MKATEEKRRGHVEVMEGVSTVALHYTVGLCFRCVPQSVLAQLQPETLLWSFPDSFIPIVYSLTVP